VPAGTNLVSGPLKLRGLLLSAVIVWTLLAPRALAQPAAGDGGRHFPPAEMMTVGVYYYPEAWPEAQWERDIANIKRFGFEFIHVGEFAWAFMEPEEGRYDFAWLERVVALAGKHGLKVVLCTPTPTPPVWLTQKHPEVSVVDDAGRTMRHGTRQHATWSSEVYRGSVTKIVTELGRRFGTNPNVWGWQLDNELSHYGKLYDYSEASQEKFRAWLKRKYGSVENLNRDWGTSFWSQRYQAFEQVRMPNEREFVAQFNPHSMLDLQRFFADNAADYIRFQTDLLRRHVKNQWVTTNFMSMHREVYPTLSRRDLDVMTWTIYPAHGRMNEGPLGYRLGDFAGMAFMHDYMRTLNPLQGIMELQPGQVNWGEFNPQPHPGAVRLWILRAFAGGARLVCTYRYRQPLYGAELYHKGIVETDGVTLSPGGREYAQAIKDVQLLRAARRPDAREPREHAARRAALLYHFDNRWDLDNHTQTSRWSTTGHVLKYHKALKSLGSPVDVVDESADFARYPFLVAPAYQLADEKLAARWKKYAEDGGHLVLTLRTAQKDRRGHLWEGEWAQPIVELIGARVPSYDVLPGTLTGTVAAGGKTYEWGVWGESLEPRSGTTALATYADHYYKGNVAAVTRRLGRGSVTYIGVESLGGELERDLLRGVFERAGVGVRDLPNGFHVEWREGFWVATNFTERTIQAPAPADAKILLGSRDVPPAGVTVWAE
jgi:beta-galactosidase